MTKAKAKPKAAEVSAEYRVSVSVRTKVDEQAGRVFIETAFRVRTPEGSPVEAPSGHFAETPPQPEGVGFSVERDVLDTDEKVRAFASAVLARFQAFGPLFLSQQGAKFLDGALDLQTGEADPRYREEVADERTLIVEHLEDTEYLLRTVYGVDSAPKKNGREPWTKKDLSRELREIARLIPTGERPTFQDAVEVLNQRNPARQLKNGEVLRKLCDRLEVKANRFRRSRGGNRNKKAVPVQSPNRNK